MHKLSLTLALALLSSAPALAADDHSWKLGNDSIHLYYSDLDMNTAAGRAQMLARVEKAARKLCDARLKADEDECVAATLDQASSAAGGRNLALAIRESGTMSLAQK